MRRGRKLVCEAVIGHCGWDTVLLLAKTDNFHISEKVVAKNVYKSELLFPGDEIGFISKKEGRNQLRLRIVDRVTQDYLPMCGGMSQVIGKALIETNFRNIFDIRIDEDRKSHVFVETDSGIVELVMEVGEDDKVDKVWTQMNDFAHFLQTKGVEDVKLSKVEGMKVGYFLVLDINLLNQRFPDCIFKDRTDKNHQKIILGIAKEYMELENMNSLYIMMYDTNCEVGGDIKFYGRFFRGNEIIISPDFEAHCGTGAVAVTLGLLRKKRGLLPEISNEGKLSVTFEFGDKRIQEEKDAYGLRTSVGKIILKEKDEISSFLYSHEVIEIIFEGKFHVPLFG